ncbi:hypothetical protein L1049_019299 [Liquidambar formosana]|uniref:Uncharacterized protein n=1 Tax=Liquidambar formosana TaxID=63359 RepID=A0AAP0X921_LIQFO
MKTTGRRHRTTKIPIKEEEEEGEEELRIQIEEEGDSNMAKKLTIVGLWCIRWYSIDRPSMKVVIQMLEGDGDNLIMPPNPFASMSETKSSAAKLRKPFMRELEIISESS